MTEMRRLLGVLRSTEETATLAPQPGVGQIPALLDRAANGGGRALQIEGEPGPLASSVATSRSTAWPRRLSATGTVSPTSRSGSARRKHSSS
jgi:hypothetical protein